MAIQCTRMARSSVWAACVGLALGGVGVPALAQSAVDNTLRIVVPFPPGGATDIMGRVLTERLGVGMNQTAITENRPGAGGNIGAAHVAKSRPDGNTLLFTAVTTPAISHTLYTNLQYDVKKDLVPVAVLGSLPFVLLVSNNLPAKNTSELVALAKQQPGKITFGSAGVGTTAHLAGELFKSLAAVNLVHVPYKGNGPALADLMGGHLDAMFDFLPSALPLVKSGRLRALAVTSPSRSPALPDVPTLAEAGVAGYDVLSYFGVFAPAGTPKAAVDKLNAEINRISQSPEMKTRFEAEGVEPAAKTTEWFARYLDDEIARWGKVIKDAGVTAQ